MTDGLNLAAAPPFDPADATDALLLHWDLTQAINILSPESSLATMEQRDESVKVDLLASGGDARLDFAEMERVLLRCGVLRRSAQQL